MSWPHLYGSPLAWTFHFSCGCSLTTLIIWMLVPIYISCNLLVFDLICFLFTTLVKHFLSIICVHFYLSLFYLIDWLLDVIRIPLEVEFCNYFPSSYLFLPSCCLVFLSMWWPIPLLLLTYSYSLSHWLSLPFILFQLEGAMFHSMKSFKTKPTLN